MTRLEKLLSAALAAWIAIAAVEGVRAQNNTGAGGGGLQAVAPIQMFKSAGAHQQLTVTSGAVVTLTPPGIATMAAFTIETNPVRMLDDGSAPTTTVGNLWSAGPAYYGASLQQLKAMQFIATAAGTSTVDVLYYTNN